MRLPRCSGDSAGAASEHVAFDALPGPRQRRDELCVEGNEVNCIVMSSMLEQRPDIELSMADLPEDGLRLARTRNIDLILLDTQLPDIDGHEVLRRLRANASTAFIQVIAVSAHALAADLAAARTAGFDGYLTKPLHLQRLLALVNGALDRSGAKDAQAPAAGFRGADSAGRTAARGRY